MKQQTGFTMLEVLVTLFITTIGLLGLTAMQLQTVKSVQDSGNRAHAIWIANDMINRIRANERDNQDQIVDHSTNGEVFCPSSSKANRLTRPETMCSPYYDGDERKAITTACSASQLAEFDLFETLCGISLVNDNNEDNEENVIDAVVTSANTLPDPGLTITPTGVDEELIIVVSWDSRTVSSDEDGNTIYIIDENNVTNSQRSFYSVTFVP